MVLLFLYNLYDCNYFFLPIWSRNNFIKNIGSELYAWFPSLKRKISNVHLFTMHMMVAWAFSTLYFNSNIKVDILLPLMSFIKRAC